MLIHYELKKILTKRANQVILLLLAVLMTYTCASALRQVEWVDEQGNWITGHAAAVKLQEAEEGWSGKLDQQLLEKTVAELKRRYNSIEIDDHSQESNWLLRYQLQGVQEIGDLLCLSFANDYSTFEEMIENLSPQELSRFYENRVEDRRAWLYGDDTSWGYYNYSDAEKAYILSRTEAMPTPMEIGYHEGWVQATGQLPTLLKYGLVLLSFVLAGGVLRRIHLENRRRVLQQLPRPRQGHRRQGGAGFCDHSGVLLVVRGHLQPDRFWKSGKRRRRAYLAVPSG